MAARVVEMLQPGPGKRFLDATFGRGGHTRLLLQSGAGVLALDKDAEAVEEARQLMSEKGVENFEMRQIDFRNLAEIVEETGPFDGLLLDLGVSSPQLDEASRGFSFQTDGPLDMRMDRRAPISAADLVNTWSEGELIRIFREYGDERNARQIASRIVQRRKEKKFVTTLELADFVEKTVGGRRGSRIHPATRVFQALRIAVNDEMGALDQALVSIRRALKPEGRLAVISFHSLEDRRVKNFIRHASEAELREPGVPFGHPNPDFFLKKLGDWSPDEDEIAENPRARSARLRVAERLKDGS